MPDTYAVMGHPISHSKSPQIHTAFARESGQDMVYTAIHVQPGGFRTAVERFMREGGKGLNITLPFKQEAWELAAHRTACAERAQAVNTLWFGEGGEIHADNTDGVGLVRDLMENHGLDLTDRRILLLGAGGAAQGVISNLLAEEPERVVIANRTVSKAEALADAFQDAGEISGCGFEALAGERFDLLINATAASLEGVVPPLPEGCLADGGWCYDMMYSERPTAFVRWGLERQAAGSVDGLGMLVEQAAEAFYRWRGVRPSTASVIAELR